MLAPSRSTTSANCGLAKPVFISSSLAPSLPAANIVSTRPRWSRHSTAMTDVSSSPSSLPGMGQRVGALVQLAEGQLADLVDQAEHVGIAVRGDADRAGHHAPATHVVERGRDVLRLGERGQPAAQQHARLAGRCRQPHELLPRHVEVELDHRTLPGQYSSGRRRWSPRRRSNLYRTCRSDYSLSRRIGRPSLGRGSDDQSIGIS